MTISKIATYSVLTIAGIAIGVTGVSALQSNAQTVASDSSTSSSSVVANTNRPNLEARKAYREVVKTALTNKDYTAWKAALAADNNPRGAEMLKLIDTQEKFDKLVEGFNARESGDTETAKKIATELGLPKRGENGGPKNDANREAIKTALANNDYEAWKKAHSDNNNPRGAEMLKLIDTQEKFDKLVEGYKARESGDTETAKKIATELGLPLHKGKGAMGMMKDR